MRKMIITLIGLIFIMSIVNAEVDIDIDIATTGNTSLDADVLTLEDVYMNADIDAGGDVFVTIDGTNINQELSDLKTSRLTVSGIDKRIVNMLLKIANYLRGIPGRYSTNEVLVADALDSYFADEYQIIDLEEKVNVLNNNLNYVYVQTEVIEKTLEQHFALTLCREKIKAMLKYGFYSVSCRDRNNDKYGLRFYNINGSVLEMSRPVINFSSVSNKVKISITTRRYIKDFEDVNISIPDRETYIIYKNGKKYRVIHNLAGLDKVIFTDNKILDGKTYNYRITRIYKGIESEPAEANITIDMSLGWDEVCSAGRLWRTNHRGGYKMIGFC